MIEKILRDKKEETLEEVAAKEYIARQNRESHPDGNFDKKGRWYPSEDEECECCNAIRSPSRRYPYSLMLHCRTAGHVANLYGVERKDILKK